jgi:nucleoside phosphorylase/tetratricopeptide (TPR) repeat protein
MKMDTTGPSVAPKAVDVAIMTPLVEEWEEMIKHLGDSHEVGDLSPASVGTIGAYSVWCQVAGKGQAEMSSALTRTIERMSPSRVILMGIAGGFPAMKVHRGDVVVVRTVLGFDFGKLVEGKFLRRPELDYNCDRQLLAFANLTARSETADWHAKIMQPRPDSKPPKDSKAHTDCYVASSDKVVDDPNHVFYRDVAASFPEIHAVETEAVGAGASVRLVQSQRAISLLVVRGVSDEPGTKEEAGTASRKEWVRYAAAAAAAFVRNLLERLPNVENLPNKKKVIPPVPTLPFDPLCLGRDQEIDQLVHAIVSDERGASLVLGALGVGKSTLISRVWHHPDLEKKYGASRYFVSCDGCRSTEAALAAIYAAFAGFVQQATPDSPNALATLEQVMSNGPLVVALDNFESTWEADPAGAEKLLQRIASVPGVALVVAVRGHERPAQLPWKCVLTLIPFSPAAARECFLQIAGDQFRSDPLLDELLGALEFLPHAVALLAHQAQGEPDLVEIRKRWDTEHSRMLAKLPANQKLTSFEMSCSLSLASPRMTPEALYALGTLSLLPAGVARSADLVPILKIPTNAPGVLRKLGLLADDPKRLRLLAPVREYVRRISRVSEEVRASVTLHVFGIVIDCSGPFGSVEARSNYGLMAGEAPNIDAAFAIAEQSRLISYEIVCQVARILAEYMRVTGVGSLAPLHLAIRLANEHHDLPLKGQCLRGLGDVLLARRAIEEAMAAYSAAVPLLLDAHDQHSLADTYKRMGHAQYLTQKLKQAAKDYRKAKTLYKLVKDAGGEADCITGLARVELAQENAIGAEILASKAQAIHLRLENLPGIANSAMLLADIAEQSGNLRRAAELYEEASEIYGLFGFDLGKAAALVELGNVLAKKGDPEAVASYRQAQSLFESVGRHPEAADLQGLTERRDRA